MDNMTGDLAYAAARAHIDDLHREGAAGRLATAGGGRRRHLLVFSTYLKGAGAQPAHHPDPENTSPSLSGLRPVARP